MKIIPNTNNEYLATECGKIYSVKSKRYLSQSASNNGYLGCSISINGIEKRMLVHRLVASAFFGVSDMQVNHKDGDKRNNSIFNLEYTSASGNIKHAFKTGLKSNKGEKHPFSKLSDNEAAEIKLLANKGAKTSELARKYNVSQAIVSGIKHGYKYSHI